MLETYRHDWVDFTQIEKLCRKAGCGSDKLVRVACKELIDNALDASPRGIEFSHQDRSFTIRDFGGGLTPDRVLRIFDITRPSLSSKRWRLARRGALGNGTRVVLGVVAVSGGHLDVESCGVCQRLTIRADGKTVAERFESEVTEGTRIRITIGPRLDFEPSEIVRYANLCQSAAGSAYGGTKAVPAWFNHTTLRELVRDMPSDTSALDFARLFDITSDALAKVKSAAMRTTTGGLLIDEERLATVCEAILDGQKGQRDLRRMGRAARPGSYDFCNATFSYGGVKLPAIVEVWAQGYPVANRKESGQISCDTIFANRTPALTQPRQGNVSAKAASIYIGGYIEVSLNGPCNFDIEIAITSPELPLLSDGKDVHFAVFERAMAKAMHGALSKAYVPPTGRVERQEKAASRFTIKEAVYSVIEDVYDTVAAAGIGAPPRMLMYKCRPSILLLTGRSKFSYQTFITHLESFIEDFPESARDWLILYDDRGHFILPDGDKIGLGTLAVDKFISQLGTDPARLVVRPSFKIEQSGVDLYKSTNPAHRFSAVVFIEKEGYFELIQKAGIAQRYDVAFASSKGMPNRAVRRLLDALTRFKIKTFCLHDFDINGLGIAHSLSTSNDRYTFENDLDFVDMGVRLADAEALGLESEPFALGRSARSKIAERLRRYGATDLEIEHLVWRQQRVEIDAMTPKQLIDFIEGKLRDHGICRLVPDDLTLEAYLKRDIIEHRLEVAIQPMRDELAERLREIAGQLNDDDIEVPALAARVRGIMDSDPGADWRAAVSRIAREVRVSS